MYRNIDILHLRWKRYFDSCPAPLSRLEGKMSILRDNCFISLNRGGNCNVNSDDDDDDDDDDDGDEKHRQEYRLEIYKGILVRKFVFATTQAKYDDYAKHRQE